MASRTKNSPFSLALLFIIIVILSSVQYRQVIILCRGATSLTTSSTTKTSVENLKYNSEEKAEPLFKDLFLSYDPNSASCQSFVAATLQRTHHQQNGDNENRSALAYEAPDPEAVRDLVRILFAHSPGKVSAEVLSIDAGAYSSTRSNRFYESRVIRLPPDSDLYSLYGGVVDDDAAPHREALAVEFQWLKFVELERVALPVPLQKAYLLEYVKTLPCIKFAEVPTPRPITDPAMVLDDNAFAPSFSRRFLQMAAISEEEIIAEPSFDRSTDLIPDDPAFHSKQFYLTAMNLPAAWDVSTGPLQSNAAAVSASVVGVADTGCDIRHPDMAQRWWRNTGEICDNGIDDDNNGYVDDCYGWNFVDNSSNLGEQLVHGTPVSASITAATNNALGIAGTCWSCLIMCLKIGRQSLTLGAFAEAINYARGFGVRTINLSAGGHGSAVEKQAMERSQAADMLFVVAAGNNACDLDGSRACVTAGYPARYPLSNILSVGASTKFDTVAGFSNIGSYSVDVFAPGQSIYLPSSSGSFKSVSGTSFSAPLAAGVAALIRSRYPQLTYIGVIQAITSTCRKVRILAGQAVCPGIVDAAAALAAAGPLYRAQLHAAGEEENEQEGRITTA